MELGISASLSLSAFQKLGHVLLSAPASLCRVSNEEVHASQHRLTSCSSTSHSLPIGSNNIKVDVFPALKPAMLLD